MFSLSKNSGIGSDSCSQNLTPKYMSLALVALFAAALTAAAPAPAYACGGCNDSGGGQGGGGGHGGGGHGGGGHGGGGHGGGGHGGGGHGGGGHGGGGGAGGGGVSGVGGGGDGESVFERMQRDAYLASAGRSAQRDRIVRRHYAPVRPARMVVQRAARPLMAPVYKRVIRPRRVKQYRPRYRTVYATRGGHYPAEVLTAPVYRASYSSYEPVYGTELSGYAAVRPARVVVRRSIRASADYGRASIRTRNVLRRSRGKVRRVKSVNAYASGYGARVESVTTSRARITGGLPRYESNHITYVDGAHGAETIVVGRRGYGSRSRAYMSPGQVSVQDVYSQPGNRPSRRGHRRCIDASGCY